jgi:hypothetical protein
MKKFNVALKKAYETPDRHHEITYFVAMLIRILHKLGYSNISARTQTPSCHHQGPSGSLLLQRCLTI